LAEKNSMNLSEHFTLEELTRCELAARKGIDNTPTAEIERNLPALCTVLLEPTRTLLGVPMHANSGYRSFRLNIAVGGSETSAHLRGAACDFSRSASRSSTPSTRSVKTCPCLSTRSSSSAIPRSILGWRAPAKQPRRQALRAPKRRAPQPDRGEQSSWVRLL
jgi:hypothetical protein